MSDIGERLKKCLEDEKWRLWNLYTIKPKTGPLIPFVPNKMQKAFLKEIAWKNVILKSRQLGFSTLVAILWLDRILFGESHTQAAIIDAKLPDAKKKLEKVRLAYKTIGKALGDERGKWLNDYIHKTRPLDQDNKEFMVWKNGGRIDVGTSFRGDTLNLLHVSEYGKISLRPDKAIEIRDGAGPASENALVIYESTHEMGRHGLHYEILEDALKNEAPYGMDLFKYHFFPWWLDKICVRDRKPRPTPEQERYFKDLEETDGIFLSDPQKAFYIAMERKHGFAVLKEFPSRFADAIAAPTKGSIYGDKIAYLRSKGRICDFEIERRYPVNVFWDLGDHDSTVMWAVQIAGKEINIVDWYENNNEPPSHYVEVLRDWESRYPIDISYLPHDGGAKKQGKTYKTRLQELGVKKVIVNKRCLSKWDGINEGREILPRCWFHSRTTYRREVNGEETPSGLDHIELYRRKIVEAGSRISDEPVHDEHSHSADALRTFFEAHMQGTVTTEFQQSRSRRGQGRRQVILASGARR